MGSLKKEIIIFVAFLILFLFISTRDPEEPKEFVNDKVVSNYSNLFFNYKIIRYPTNVSIVSFTTENIDVGIVTDPWNLNFGIIPGNGSYIKRYMNLNNFREKYNRIYIKAYGNITPLIKFSKNFFSLKENESTVIEVGLYTDSADLGNYTGEIDVIIKIPKYESLSMFV